MHQIRDCVWYALLEQREGHRLWGIWTKSKDQKTNALFGSKSWFCWGKAACFPVLLHRCFHLWSFISVMGQRRSSIKTPDQGAFSSPSPESRGQTSRGSALQWVGCTSWSAAPSSFRGGPVQWHVTQTSPQASVHLSLRSLTFLGKAQTQ